MRWKSFRWVSRACPLSVELCLAHEVRARYDRRARPWGKVRPWAGIQSIHKDCRQSSGLSAGSLHWIACAKMRPASSTVDGDKKEYGCASAWTRYHRSVSAARTGATKKAAKLSRRWAKGCQGRARIAAVNRRAVIHTRILVASRAVRSYGSDARCGRCWHCRCDAQSHVWKLNAIVGATFR